MTPAAARQPIVYAAIGLCIALLNNISIIWLSRHMHYLAATTLAFVFVTPCAFLLHSRFTFGADGSWPAFVRYGGGALLMYPFALALIALLCGVARLPVPLAIPIATLILFVCNFTIARWAIVRRAG